MIPREVFEQTLMSFLEPIRPYFEDPTVTDILINGPEEVFVERGGRLEQTGARFSSPDLLWAAIRNLAQYVGRHADAHRPILEGRLPDGSRVEAVLPPAAPDGPMLAIRRFFREALTVDRLLELGSLTSDAAELLRALVACKQNIVVAGGTGSGKTSMLNVLSSLIDSTERIVVIEDSRELQLQQPHVVQLEARPPDPRGRGEVTVRELFRATLRLRPDRIVVGEIRGGEALDLVQAMTSGHSGCLSTVHATYPTDTVNRLETMALMSDVDIPLHALRAQIAAAVDIVVQTSRAQDGSRCVTHIAQVTGYDPSGGYELENLFERVWMGKDERGRMVSRFVPTGLLPACHEMMRALGLRLPDSMHDAEVDGRTVPK